MRTVIVTVALTLSAALAPSATARVPLPCDYWVHSCDASAYVCDVGVCVDATLPGTPATKP